MCLGVLGSGTESDSDESVPDLEEQDSAQTQTQQAQVRYFGSAHTKKALFFLHFIFSHHFFFSFTLT